jgi:hypothetical protein
MSLAFEITAEDIQIALSHNLQLQCDSEVAEKLLDEIDVEKIERAALRGDDLEDQTLYAHEAIVNELTDLKRVVFDVNSSGFKIMESL